MPGTIFVSHSRRDKNLEFFHKVFAASRAHPVFVELERIERPAWKSIKEFVSGSECVFLLLSRDLLENEHTQNWVSFEIGLASALDKTLWVLESADEPISFPVPYCNYHMIFDPGDETFFFLIKEIADSLGVCTSGRSVTCLNDRCKLKFSVPYDSNVYICPACRKDIYC